MRMPIVCGGRDFTDRDFVFATLDRLSRETGGGFIAITEGGCPTGVDKFAYEWAASTQTTCNHYPVSKEEWLYLGRRAGPLRNQKMIDLEKPDGCIAFPGGTGTADMVRRATAAGIPVIVCEPLPKGP